MKDKIASIAKELLPYIIIVIVVFGIKTYIATPVLVDGSSMLPTLSDKQFLILNRSTKKLNRNDIVVFDHDNSKLIKRIIALPGETIEYKDGVLYINDEVVNEDFISNEVRELTGRIYKKTLGENEYYVMGDNRGGSSDSRDFGAITKSEIRGRGLLRFMICTKKDENNECSKRKFVWPSSVK